MKLITEPKFNVSTVEVTPHNNRYGVQTVLRVAGKITWEPVQVELDKNSSYNLSIGETPTKADMVIDGYKFYGAFWETLDFLNHIGILVYDYAEPYPLVELSFPSTAITPPRINRPFCDRPLPEPKLSLLKRILNWF